ncbi:hypothetical protein HDU99_005145, partial [Rhizoclosmatium hyalinum]
VDETRMTMEGEVEEAGIMEDLLQVEAHTLTVKEKPDEETHLQEGLWEDWLVVTLGVGALTSDVDDTGSGASTRTLPLFIIVLM